MHRSALNGSVDIMQSLTSRLDQAQRRAVVAEWHNGLQPLHLAAKGGHVAVASWLLDQGAPIDTAKERELRTPLHWASQRGHSALVRRRPTHLTRPTRSAVYEQVELLLEHGAPVDALDKVGVQAVQCDHTTATRSIVAAHLTCFARPAQVCRVRWAPGCCSNVDQGWCYVQESWCRNLVSAAGPAFVYSSDRPSPAKNAFLKKQPFARSIDLAEQNGHQQVVDWLRTYEMGGTRPV